MNLEKSIMWAAIVIAIGGFITVGGGIWAAVATYKKSKKDAEVDASNFDKSLNRLDNLKNTLKDQGSEINDRLNTSIDRLITIKESLEETERIKSEDLENRLTMSFKKINDLGSVFMGAFSNYSTEKQIEELKKIATSFIYLSGEELQNPILKQKQYYKVWEEFYDSVNEHVFSLSGGYSFDEVGYEKLAKTIQTSYFKFVSSMSHEYSMER